MSATTVYFLVLFKNSTENDSVETVGLQCLFAVHAVCDLLYVPTHSVNSKFEGVKCTQFIFIVKSLIFSRLINFSDLAVLLLFFYFFLLLIVRKMLGEKKIPESFL